MILYPIPGVYRNSDAFDISVIIPMYKSKEVIEDQIRRWPTTDKGLSVELIYVDDRCPTHSSQAVMQGWTKRRDAKEFNVRLVLNERNKGFGEACNTGAFYAKGRYLIFLNADTVPDPNWLWPIYELFEKDAKVGIVGNLQLKEGGEHHGTIDSAGSEWYWPERNFLHIGRHIYKGELLEKPMSPKELPQEPVEREMVTGCCLAIRSELYKNIGGFNQSYRIGYWEDSELNMAVRDKGYKVIFQPKSIIWHKLSHAKVGQHIYHEVNKEYFLNKWDASTRIDSLVSSPRPLKRTNIRLVLIRRNAANGDVLLASGVASALKNKYNAEIHFCTDCPSVLLHNPFIDKITDDLESFQNLHRYQYIVELDNVYERRPTVHLLESYAEQAGVQMSDMKFHFHTARPDCELPNKYIVMHPGLTAWVGRNWNEAHFNSIGQKLMEMGHQVVCIGQGADRKIEGAIDLRSRVNLYEMAWIIKNASYFIGIDSMPMHVAQVLETPGSVFFGSIDPKLRLFRDNMHGLTAPNVACLGCHHRRQPPCTSLNFCETKTFDCETKLTFEMAWEKIKERICNLNI